MPIRQKLNPAVVHFSFFHDWQCRLEVTVIDNILMFICFVFFCFSSKREGEETKEQGEREDNETLKALIRFR